jgi:hypothetical protein
VNHRDQLRLQTLTRELIEARLAREPWRANVASLGGFNLCGEVVLAGQEAARRLGLASRLIIGTVHDPRTGRQVSRGWHAWLRLSGGVLLDSPQPGELHLGTAAERGLRYRPLRHQPRWRA